MQREDKYGPMTIESFDNFIWYILNTSVHDRSLWDDCRQEALIKVWQIRTQHPHQPAPYIRKAIENCIRNVSARGRMTGMVGRNNRIDPLRIPHESIDQMSERGVVVSQQDASDPQSDERLTSSAVQEAVRALPERQRDHVVMVFYLGYSHRKTGSLHRTWYPARDKLREQLKDLAA